jgi:hypothetical protein
VGVPACGEHAPVRLPWWGVFSEPSDAPLTLQALATARALPVGDRSAAVIAMERLLSNDSLNQALIKRALVAADRLTKGRSGALAVIAEQLAVVDTDWAIRLFDEAVTHARGVPFDRERDMALAFIAERMAVADPSNPMLLDRALAVAEKARLCVGQRRLSATGWRR